MRRAASVLAWFALLFGFWELLAGTFQSTELYGGLMAAGLGALFAELLRSLGLLRFSLRWLEALRVLKLLWTLPVEMGVVTWVLLRALTCGRRVRGQWVRVPLPGGAGARAFATVVGTATPNAVVVDVAEGEALLHALAPDLPGGRETT